MVKHDPVDGLPRPLAAPAVLPDTSDISVLGPAWCAAQAAIMAARAQIVLLWRDETGVLRLRGLHPDGLSPGETLRAAMTDAAETRKPVVTTGAENAAVALPLTDGEMVFAVAGAAMPPGSAASAEAAIGHLTWGAAALEAWHLRHGASTARGAADLALALGLITGAAEAPTYRAAVQSVVQTIAAWLSADRVSLAWHRGWPRGVRVEAVSGAAHFRRNTEAIERIAAAAEEAVEQGQLLQWPQPPDAGYAVAVAQAALARAHDATVLSAPLGDPEAPWGAVVIELTSGPHLEAGRLAALAYALDALAPVLEARRREDRLLVVKAADVFGTHLGRLFGPGYPVRKLAAAAALALALAAATLTGTHRVTASLRIEADNHRVLTAPFDGYLADQFARPGDPVTTGQVLAALDPRELLLERLRHVATLQQKQVEWSRAVAEGNRGRINLLGAEIREVEAQIDLAGEMLAAAVIRAPFDGLVVAGDLTRRTGSPVARGEELLTVAPLDGYKAVLMTPDRDFELVRRGQTGTLRLAAIPEVPIAFRIVHLTPVTEVHDGLNTFRVEARLDRAPLRLISPGMEGVAKVDVGEKLWVRIVFDPLIDWARLALWRWWP